MNDSGYVNIKHHIAQNQNYVLSTERKTEDDFNENAVEIEKEQPKMSVLSKSAISPGNVIISSKYNRNNIKSEIFKEKRSSCKYSDPPTIGTHRE